MGHMDVLRAEFAGHALRKRAKRMLGTRKRGIVFLASQTRSSAGKENRAALTLYHALGNFPCVQKSCKAGHLPDLEVLSRCLLKDGRRHIGANVKYENVNWADLGLNLVDEGDHLLLLARVRAKRVGDSAGIVNGVNQRLELVRCTTRHTSDHAFRGETLGDCTTRGVPRSDHERDPLLSDIHHRLLY